MPYGTEVGFGSDHIVLDWNPSPPPRKGSGAPSPIFGPCQSWPNGWMDQDGPWHGGGPWSRPHCAKWERSSPPRKGGRAPDPQFSAHFYCGQTAGCIKMPLGMEVGRGLRDIVLDGDPAPPPLKGHSPQLLADVRCGQTADELKCYLV